MELSDLKVFSAVARCGGITRAASELNTVPSNVTTRIRTLEAEIGVPLFERHARGMTLTGAGRRLLPYADRLASLSRQALVAARDDGVPKGTLTIGSMETAAAVRLPPLLTRFHQSYPAVQLHLKTGPTAALVADVLNAALDGAFVAGPIDHPDLEEVPAFNEELVLVTAQRWHSLAELQAETRASGPSILVFRTGCSYRQRLEQVLSELGWPCAVRLEFGTLDGIIGCVAADMGITMLPRAVIEQSAQGANVRVHEVDRPATRALTLFIRRREAHADAALRCFVSMLESSTVLPSRAGLDVPVSNRQLQHQ